MLKKVISVLLTLILILSVVFFIPVNAASNDFKLEYIIAVGNGDENWLHNANWDLTATENIMTEVEPGIWEITYEDVYAFNGYDVIFACNGSYQPYSWRMDGMLASGYSPYPPISVPEDGSTVTLRINVSNFNFETGEGTVKPEAIVTPPETKPSTETEPQIPTDDTNIYFTIPDFWIDKYGFVPGTTKVYCHLFQIGNLDPDFYGYGWQTRYEQTTYDVATGKYVYPVGTKYPDLKEYADYGVVFSAKNLSGNQDSVQSYDLTMGTDCFGDEVYVTDTFYDNPMDSNKNENAAYWKSEANAEKYGPHACITSLGVIQGEKYAPHEDKALVVANFIKDYYCNIKPETCPKLCEQLEVEPYDVLEKYAVKYKDLIEVGSVPNLETVAGYLGLALPETTEPTSIPSEPETTLPYPPETDPPVETEPQIPTDDTNIYFTIPDFWIDKYGFVPGTTKVYCHLFQIGNLDTEFTEYAWQTRNEQATYDVATGKYVYPVGVKFPKLKDYADYGIIFSAKNTSGNQASVEAYDLTMGTDCFGDEAYVVSDVVYENPMNPSRTGNACYWKSDANAAKYGPHAGITSLGVLQGEKYAPHEDRAQAVANFIGGYPENVKAENCVTLCEQLEVDPYDVIEKYIATFETAIEVGTALSVDTVARYLGIVYPKPEETDPEPEPTTETEPQIPTGDYFVAGDFLNPLWDCASNPMTKCNNEFGGSKYDYVLTIFDVPMGEWSFKVTDGTWDNAWGKLGTNNENYSFNLSAPCNVTIYFNSETKEIAVEAELITPAETEPSTTEPTSIPSEPETTLPYPPATEPIGDYFVAGDFLNPLWDYASNPMTKCTHEFDGSKYDYVLTIYNVSAGEWAFKVTDGTWYNSWGNGTENYIFTLSYACDVTIHFNSKTRGIAVEAEFVIPPDTEPPTTEPIKILGDADGDGVVTVKDATCIQMYLASFLREDEISLDVCDTDGDGVVTVKDATHIQLQLAGFL